VAHLIILQARNVKQKAGAAWLAETIPSQTTCAVFLLLLLLLVS
jgi:hypothetical protein